MNTQIAFVLVSLLLVASIAQAKPVDSPEAPAKPNVIFIKTDDQRFDSLSMTGHPVTKTPTSTCWQPKESSSIKR